MDAQLICPFCHVAVRPTDFFCFNCGKNLHPKNLSASASAQIVLYLKCLILLPLGIVWGVRYLRQSDRKSKIVGLIAIIITIVSLVVVIRATLNVVNTFNQQLSSQMQGFQGL